MRGDNRDFIEIEDSLDVFLADDVVIEKMQMINGEINDWEKWLQIELQYYFQHHPLFQCQREKQFSLTLPGSAIRRVMSVDLVLKRETTKAIQDIYVELKCVKRLSTLRRVLQKDYAKLHLLAQHQPMRSFWCIAFYWNYDESDVAMAPFLAGYKYAVHKAIDLCGCGDPHCEEARMGYVIIGGKR
ncbi:PD-(D/E)XK nuclease superfamily protein [Kosakonia sp. BK9b]|uniref:hypothetical protein n=1 Tax=Kosakonia sp. TaxID=1916651 RepID=UPI0028A290F0|nr:hypothetical protein [Kosakonia sp.]